MDPILILCFPMLLTLTLALIFGARRMLQELRDESLPLPARKSLIINGIDVAISPLDHESFTERDAVYAILGAKPDASFEVIDAGDTSEFGSPPIHTPEREASWLQRNRSIWVGVYLLDSDEDTPQGRNAIMRQLLN